MPPSTTPRAVAAEPRFDILEFAVEGSTLLPVAEVEQAVYPHMGPGKTFADAEAARRALEQAYQRAGYLSVGVTLPAQQINREGVVRLQVVEAQVDRVKISGSRYYLPSQIKQGLPSVQPGAVPNFNAMQDELAELAQRAPERVITPLISASDDGSRINVDLQVQDKPPLSAQLEVNTGQGYNTQRGRIEASVAYANLFQRGHRLTANWMVSPHGTDEMNILVLGYGLKLDPLTDLIFLFGSNDSRTPTDVGGATLSRGHIAQARLTHALPNRGGSYSHTLIAGADFANVRDANEDVFGFSTRSPGVRYPKFVLGYQLNDEGEVSGQRSSFNAELSFGVGGLGGRTVDCNGTPLDQFACKRSGAKPDFQVLKLSASHREPMFGRWSLYAEAELQVASGTLTPLEKIGVGGVDSVRGYYDFEQTGDQGWKLRLELGTPPLVSVGDAVLTALTFYDRASVSVQQPLPELVADDNSVLRTEELRRVHLGSYGVGLRFESGERWKATLDYAVPVFDTSKRDGAGQFYVPVSGKGGRRARWDASLRYAF